MKKPLLRFKNIFEQIEGRKRELEHRAVEITESEEQKKIEGKLEEPEGSVKCHQIK